MFFASSAVAGFALAYQWTSSRVAPPKIPVTGLAIDPAITGVPITVAEPAGAQPSKHESRETTTPGFDAWIDRLTAHTIRTAELCTADRIDDARREDHKATELFVAMLATFPDAGERAVGLVSSPASEARLTVLGLVIASGCAQRRDPGNLVAAVLEAMSLDGTATGVGGVLVDKPWLRARHETAVLKLVAQAHTSGSKRPIATALLWTLWDNMLRRGERSAVELRNLAMMQLASENACRRIVACRYLLLDPTHRDAALGWLRRRESPTVVMEITQLAATDLLPLDAMAVLRQVASIAPPLSGAYMVLAARSTEAVVSGYYELLASDTHPSQRRELIASLTMATDLSEARAAVELALSADRSSLVRVQAMLTLSALAPDTGEVACNQILDHPETGRDPESLAIVVFALGNLEAAGMVNAVKRLGQRLQTRPLGRASQTMLHRILGEGLPAALRPNPQVAGYLGKLRR